MSSDNDLDKNLEVDNNLSFQMKMVRVSCFIVVEMVCEKTLDCLNLTLTNYNSAIFRFVPGWLSSGIYEIYPVVSLSNIAASSFNLRNNQLLYEVLKI